MAGCSLFLSVRQSFVACVFRVPLRTVAWGAVKVIWPCVLRRSEENNLTGHLCLL